MGTPARPLFVFAKGNWVVPAKEGERPRFYGNMFGYHDVTDSSDSAMEPPLCWITNAFDRSPAELLWVTSDKWGPLKGSLLNLSYGYGKVFVVPHESVARAASLSVSSKQADDAKRQGGEKKEKEKEGTGRPPMLRQGGLCELPIPQFPTGIMLTTVPSISMRRLSRSRTLSCVPTVAPCSSNSRTSNQRGACRSNTSCPARTANRSTD
jgi:hypothetical protein